MKTIRGHEVVKCPYYGWGEPCPCPYVVIDRDDHRINWCFKDEKSEICIFEKEESVD